MQAQAPLEGELEEQDVLFAEHGQFVENRAWGQVSLRPYSLLMDRNARRGRSRLDAGQLSAKQVLSLSRGERRKRDERSPWSSSAERAPGRGRFAQEPR